jgi:peptidoglycan-associated lipoprotein
MTIRTLPTALSICLCLIGAACTTTPAKRAATVSAAPRVCTDFSFPIYFDKGSDQLTAPAQAVLNSSALQAKGCLVSKVEVLGLADADGRANRNLALSHRRAARVAAALSAFGLPAPAFDIEAIGEAGAKAADGAPEPLRRRTEVVIHASSRSAARL